MKIKPLFDKFLRGLGVERIADELLVADSTVYRWLRGSNMPQLSDGRRLVELAAKHGYQLTLEDVRPGMPTETWEARARARRNRRRARNLNLPADNESKSEPALLAMAS